MIPIPHTLSQKALVFLSSSTLVTSCSSILYLQHYGSLLYRTSPNILEIEPYRITMAEELSKNFETLQLHAGNKPLRRYED